MANVENGALQIAIDNAAVNETIVLTSDIVVTNRITISNVVTIDLNGYAINGDIDDGYGTIYVGTKGALTIIDSSSKKTGSITNSIGNAIGNYGIVNIYDGTFTGNYALYNFYYNDNVYGTAAVFGGTFKSINSNSPSIANCGILVINGGAIESIDTSNVLTVTNGTIESLYVGVADYNPSTQSTSINGGAITTFSVADNSVNDVVISGGTFKSAIDSKYLADGAKFTYNESSGVYEATVSKGLKVIATSSSRIKDLVIKDSQLIFIQDLGRIAFDFKGKRVFYNQIVKLDTDVERKNLDSPLPGYYFVVDTAILWFYEDDWVQITERPESAVCIDVELPELGQAKDGVLYVNKMDREISVFDSNSNEYVVVSDYTNEITDEDILKLFS